MKTTVNIADDLYERMRLASQRTGQSMRAIIEEGIRRVLSAEEPPRYQLPDCSVGDPADPDPLAGYSWQDLREEIYGAG